MLYVGADAQGEPLILHTVWGLKAYYKNPKLQQMLKQYPLEGMHYNTEKDMLESIELK